MPDRNNPPPPKVIPGGIVVKPNLQINQLTLRQRIELTKQASKIPLARKEAEAIGYPLEEIEREFRRWIDLIDDTRNHLPRINSIWAFLSVDDDGTEGVVACQQGGMIAPMIAAERARLDSLLPIARDIARISRKRIVLVRFEAKVDQEIIDGSH